MKKIGFVTPWFGMNIPGGAEAALRGLVLHLHDAGQELEILTTCVERFASDWNTDYHPEGLTVENGIPVRRFRVRRRDTAAFDAVNYKLMTNRPLTADEEETYSREMVNSPALYEYMAAHRDEYSLFVFIPYMFGTSTNGSMVCPEKTVLIPCLHDEAYARLASVRNMFEKAAGIVYLARPEQVLAESLYDISHARQKVLGIGVFDKEKTEADAARFREKYGIKDDFIIYAGRKDAGKNVDVLLSYFAAYKKQKRLKARWEHNDTAACMAAALKLVLVGGGSVGIPGSVHGDVYDLGFVSAEDKYDAMAASAALCQPSTHESFSIVIMESWLCGRPVLVSGGCGVTKDFAVSSGGGLYFDNYAEFAGCVDFLLEHADTASAMGTNGRDFVLDNFSWDTVTGRYMEFFKSLAGD